MADAITDNPLAQSSFPINDEFEIFQPDTDNPLIVRKKEEEHQQNLQAKRDQVWAKAQTLFASAPSKQTKTAEFLSVFHEIRKDIDELRKKGDIR